MTHLQRQIDELKNRVEHLEGKLEDKNRGLALAHDDADFYEQKWAEQIDALKELLKQTASFIKTIGSDDDEPQKALLLEIERAVGRKVEPVDVFEDFDAQLTIDLLGLVTEHEIPFETVAAWTREQRMAAEKWAAEQHALASDNDIPVPLMEKPAHVVELEKNNPKRDDLYDVELKAPPGAFVHPGILWAQRMKDSPKEWERLHRIELAARHTRARYRQRDRDQAASEMCRVIDAVELERIQEFQGRSWRHGEKKKS